MKAFTYTCFLSILVVLVGCSSPEEPKTDTLTVRALYPAGIKWTYQHNVYDNLGNKTPRYKTERSVDTSATYRGHDAYDLDLDYDHIEFYYEADTAMYWFDRKTGATDFGFRYPMREGEEYVYYSNGLPSGHQELKILTLSKKSISIIVPAGTFECILCKKMTCTAEAGIRTDTTSTDDYYFAPKQGLVRMDGFSYSNGIKFLSSDQILLSLEKMK